MRVSQRVVVFAITLIVACVSGNAISSATKSPTGRVSDRVQIEKAIPDSYDRRSIKAVYAKWKGRRLAIVCATPKVPPVTVGKRPYARLFFIALAPDGARIRWSYECVDGNICEDIALIYKGSRWMLVSVTVAPWSGSSKWHVRSVYRYRGNAAAPAVVFSAHYVDGGSVVLQGSDGSQPAILVYEYDFGKDRADFGSFRHIVKFRLYTPTARGPYVVSRTVFTRLAYSDFNEAYRETVQTLRQGYDPRFLFPRAIGRE